MTYRLIAVTLLLAACGDDGGTGPLDSSVPIDTAGATVMEVSCTGITPNASVVTTDAQSSYTPMATTIATGQVVKFTTSFTHDVKPNSLSHSDPGLVVGFNKVACLKFTAAGTFNFLCSNHGFVGSVTVN
jgi:plastocyanin